LPQRTQRAQRKIFLTAKGRREENYKLQITNYKQITNYNDQNYKPFFGNGIQMVPMGQYIIKRGTMVDRVSKAFEGGPGAQFSRKEPPWWVCGDKN
jgi:hypothetical protein